MLTNLKRIEKDHEKSEKKLFEATDMNDKLNEALFKNKKDSE